MNLYKYVCIISLCVKYLAYDTNAVFYARECRFSYAEQSSALELPDLNIERMNDQYFFSTMVESNAQLYIFLKICIE